MNFRRLLICSLITIPAFATSMALAQRPGSVPRPQAAPRFRKPCDFGEPRTKLEWLDEQIEKVIVRGSTTVGIVTGRNGFLRIEAIELRDEPSANRALGVIVTFREANRQESEGVPNEIRSFMDYEDIEPLIKGLDSVAKTDDTVTKLANFEAHYTTKGELEIAGFRQTPGGAVAASVTGGVCERVRILLSLEELNKFRYWIGQAKVRLDELTP